MRAKQRKDSRKIVIPYHPTHQRKLRAAPPLTARGPARAGLAASSLLLASLPLSSALRDENLNLVSPADAGVRFPLRSRRLICWPVSPFRCWLVSPAKRRDSPPALVGEAPAAKIVSLVQRSHGLRARLYEALRAKNIFERPAHLPRLLAEPRQRRGLSGLFSPGEARRGNG